MDASGILESRGRNLVTWGLSRKPKRGQGLPMGSLLVQGNQEITKLALQEHPIPDIGNIGPRGN